MTTPDWSLTGGPGSGAVTFPTGSVQETTRVTGLLRGPEGLLVLTDATPFHPVDPFWPDQPDDHGFLDLDGHRFAVTRTVTVALLPDGRAQVDTGITAGRRDADVDLTVGHLVPAADARLLGTDVVLTVDADRRFMLSAAHTACHLAAFALNESLAPLWKKSGPTDSLGHPDFDRAANTVSRHFPDGTAVDRYRLGKSLRKQVDVDALLSRLDAVVADINARLERWLASDAPVYLLTAGFRLADRRTWSCDLPAGTAQMACGGTHLKSLGQLTAAVVEIAVSDDEAELTVTTRTRSAT